MDILCRKEGAVCTLRFNRPRRATFAAICARRKSDFSGKD